MSNDRLFTVIVEFKGGTYIGQIYADVPISTPRHWLAIQRDEDLITWGICRDELQAQLKSNRLVTLDGLASVWCTTRIHNDTLILFNIVETVQKKTQG